MAEQLEAVIRPMDIERDMDAVIAIWLQASLAAHDFIAASYWQGQVCAMKEQYLLHAQNYVYAEGGIILGFYAVVKDTNGIAEESVFLHALFVHPDAQGLRIGSQLMAHLKLQLTAPVQWIYLRVYCNNAGAIRFYQKHGFEVTAKQVDENTGEEELLMAWSKIKPKE